MSNRSVVYDRWMDKWGLDASQHSAGESIMSDDDDMLAYEQARKRSARMAFAVLFLAALFACLMTYFYGEAAQQSDCKVAFESFARETAVVAQSNAETILGQLKMLSTAITSAKLDQEEFPYVTIPHFDLRTKEIAELTGIEMIIYAPFVEQDSQSAWERFHVYNQEDTAYQDLDPAAPETMPTNIHSYTLPPGYREKRDGFVDDGFMEQILANASHNHTNFSVPIAWYGPGIQDTSGIMLDLLTHPIFKKEIVTSLEYNIPVISEIEDLEFLLQHLRPPTGATWDYSILRSFALYQVKEDFHPESPTVGYVIGVVPWNAFFRNQLPANVNGIVVKVVSDCGQVHTHVIHGDKEGTSQLGDAHDPKYGHSWIQKYPFFQKDHHNGTSRHCHFDLQIYPSPEFEAACKSNAPLVYVSVVLAVFVFAAIVLVMYDAVQKHLQYNVLEQKAMAEAVVLSLFPTAVAQQLMAEQQSAQPIGTKDTPNKVPDTDHRRNRSHSVALSEFLSLPDLQIQSTRTKGHGTGTGTATRTKPLADLFPFATVMFADIVGFTAWSSVREPSQVFALLETLYQNFDKIATRRKIFKVETIGDCYVAVSGLPQARRDHAPAIAMFAKECLDKFRQLVEMLEVELGPDTADLGLRTGLHSGPVTAGVLRGERARFQLFGDTVNTTARIEASGENGKIHLSEECAEELRKFGKGCWVVPRKDKISAKGKGILSTCWLEIDDDGKTESTEASSLSRLAEEDNGEESALPLKIPTTRLMGSRAKSQFELLDEKNSRLIEWNMETLKHLLESIVAKRASSSQSPGDVFDEQEVHKNRCQGKLVFDEVAEIINLPHYDQANNQAKASVILSEEIVGQIRAYVSRIAKLYPDNPFHNFDHASHVAMSVSKLLSRIVAPKIDDAACDGQELEKRIHDHTYGITSDPLTQFACVFSALIHDCEHDGVPNAQLVKEEHHLAIRYNNISVAEQNSVDVAWDILMQPRFQALRSAIYSTKDEMVRFRQLVVNSVMATDIVDKELKALRNARWEKAFQKGKEYLPDENDVSRKATIVIEHLIQASDVSHTMQHWHIFHKWNENLFREMYTAYKAGRSEKDPSEVWYTGEIGFFDFYIIPLAKKLKECGVFGVSSDEYLNYAQSNRREWEQKGEEIVNIYVAKYEADARAKNCVVMEKQLCRQRSKKVLSCPAPDFTETELELASVEVAASKSSAPKKRVSFSPMFLPLPTVDALREERIPSMGEQEV